MFKNVNSNFLIVMAYRLIFRSNQAKWKKIGIAQYKTDTEQYKSKTIPFRLEIETLAKKNIL